MQFKALVIEDDPAIADLIRLYLRNDGINARVEADAEAGLAFLAGEAVDVVLLDLNLPGMNGFEFLQSLRKASSVPVLIVSAREEDADMVLGFGLGADDFIVKPFSPRVLVARVRAHLRRVQIAAGDRIVSFGPFTLNLDAMILKRGDERIPLPTREMDLLAFLAGHPGKAYRSEELYSEVWGNPYGDITTVAVHIQRIRKKMEPDSKAPVYLRTVHGRGYQFSPEGAA
jgi:DNA-binding response OmpR family regulator